MAHLFGVFFRSVDLEGGDANVYYQKQSADEVRNQMNDLISKLSSILNIHLSTGQQTIIDTPEVFMNLKSQSVDSLTNHRIANTEIRFPATFVTSTSSNTTVSVRGLMQPLAIFGSSPFSANTNLSRSVSLSVSDPNGNEVRIQANQTHPIEMLIPRDPTLVLPAMILQNGTSINSTSHQQFFHLHYVNLSSQLPISVHLEISPLDLSLAYLFVYKFDQIPQFNSLINDIEGWTIFCPSNLSNDSIYAYFLDNQLTENHQSLVFGLRQLNSTYCSTSLPANPPIPNQRYYFTANYRLRVYSSGCYYLDEKNQWNGQGLRVGPLTNHQQTQCFSCFT